MRTRDIKLLMVTILVFLSNQQFANDNLHPRLILTKSDIIKIRPQISHFDLFNKSFLGAIEIVDDALMKKLDVPVPLHAGGGYTHEKHKQNYNEMYYAGILYQFTKDKKYLHFIKNMLDLYAKLYPTLGSHPEGKKHIPGRLFWQTLNESVWLLNTIQAYDCIYEELSEEERKYFENNIFVPMAEFFINDCRSKFDQIHNHGTWMVAAVGMTGFVLDNPDYVNKSIYGFNNDEKTGFLAQLNELFSPDGFYTEGGYYARYALWPFYIFAESINNNLPDLKIYDYRDKILRKALHSTLQVTHTSGEFIPFNDAIKGKSWLTPELIFATNFAYTNYGQDKSLLKLVKLHDKVALSGAGLRVAKDLMALSEEPKFEWKSIEFADGPMGDKGGLTILRYGDSNDQETLVFKYGSHGLSHGHFDKLNIIFYDQGKEILPDYGAARFVNIEQKFGGRYLPENQSYAKQTIAHNTIVVDESSQFNGKRDLSEQHHSDKYFVNFTDPIFQYASAKENNAYNGVELHRTLCMVKDKILTKPIIIDVFRVKSDKSHQYDLPFYYKGQFISINFEYDSFTSTKTLMGKDHGYQHLWKEAEGRPQGLTRFTWLSGNRFYTLTSNTKGGSEIYFTRTGGTDPNFNLRSEPGLIIRENRKSKCFVSIIEPHGSFDPVTELTTEPDAKIREIEVLRSDSLYTVLNIRGKFKIDWYLMISNSDPNINLNHSLQISDKKFSWKGPISLIKNKEQQ